MKTYRYVGILLLSYFSQGLLLSVLSLIFLDMGLTLGGIAIAIGVYSVTIALLEVPSGIAADMVGKKKIFILSLLVTAASIATLVLSHGFVWVMVGITFFGVGRALSSGSLEALFIDRYGLSFGTEGLPKAIKLLSLSESIGLATGALMGGFLPVLSVRLLPKLGPYDLNLLLRITFSLVLVVLVQCLIPVDLPHSNTEKVSLLKHMRNSFGVIRQSHNVKWLFISVLGTGFVLCVLESYWQPHFIGLLGNQTGQTGLLGVLSLLYSGAATVGNILCERLLTKQVFGHKTLYIVCRFFMILSLVLIALQGHPVGFAISYCLLYFFFGAANISEGTLINQEVPNQSRASVLSTQSLVLQVGMLSASATSKALADQHPVTLLWLIAAGIAALCLLPAFKIKERATPDGQ